MAFGVAGDVVLCSWARYFTLSKCLSLQVYNWVMDLCPIQGEVGGRNILSRFMLRRKQK